VHEDRPADGQVLPHLTGRRRTDHLGDRGDETQREEEDVGLAQHGGNLGGRNMGVMDDEGARDPDSPDLLRGLGRVQVQPNVGATEHTDRGHEVAESVVVGVVDRPGVDDVDSIPGENP